MIGRINKNNLLKIEELKVLKLKKKFRAIFISFLPMELFLFSASLGNSDNVLVRWYFGTFLCYGYSTISLIRISREMMILFELQKDYKNSSYELQRLYCILTKGNIKER